MQKKKLIISSILISVVFAGLLTYYFNRKILTTVEFYETYYDTNIIINVWHYKELSTKQKAELEEVIKDVQFTFSRTDENSELYKMNQQSGKGPVKVSDELYKILKISLEYAEKTNGKFEPTIGPLVDAWGIATDNPRVPTSEEIERLKKLIDYRLVELNDEEQTVNLPLEGMVIDLGSIAKGYAADKIKEYLQSIGIKHALINLGGNVITIGERYAKNTEGNKDWGIAIRDPKIEFVTVPLGLVYVTDKTVVTSGTYERNFYDEDTKRYYHHILDPHTGYPVENNIASVSIITSSSTTADALSTSVYALGIEEGKKLIDNLDDVEAMFITYSGEIIKTSGFDSKYTFKIIE